MFKYFSFYRLLFVLCFGEILGSFGLYCLTGVELFSIHFLYYLGLYNITWLQGGVYWDTF